MKNSRTRAFNGMKFAAWLLIVMGIAFLCVNFFVNIFPHLTRDLLQTEAEITEIRFLGYDSDDSAQYATVVRYTVDGREYNSELSYHSSSDHPGDIIKIYYDAAQPGYAIAATPVLAVVFALVGAALTVGGVVMLLSQRKGKKLAAQLRENGRRVTAEVMSVTVNTSLEINGRNPYVVTCTCSDPFTGACTEYKSKNLWKDPGLSPGDPVYVYVDRADPKKYYVDV